MKRKIESLERDNAILHELMNQIRGGDDLEVRQIASLVRSNASLPEVHNSLIRLRETAESTHQRVNPVIEQWHHTTRTALLQDSHPQSRSQSQLPQPTVTAEPASRVLSVNRLIDNPIHQVSASHWTTVTRDDHLVSHLVSLWATWNHFFPDGIVLEPFLRDLKAGNLDSPFCSPFLVSCILAAACPFSDYDEAKTTRGIASELMQSFVKEAKERLTQSQSTPSITNVQGLGVLYVVTSEMSQDRDGYHYAIQAATMGEELARGREGILKTAKSNEARKELAFVLDTTCWGIFSATAASMSAWMRPQLLMQPKVPYPKPDSIEKDFYKTKWLPYPRSGIPQDIELYEVLQRYASLATLTAELTDELYGDRDDERRYLRGEVLKDLDIRLVFWHAKLPEHMKQASPESPAVTTLMMWYHGIALKLQRERVRHRLRARRPGNPEDDNDEGDEDDEDKRMYLDEPSAKNKISADARSDQDLARTALDIVDLCRSYRVRFEYSRLNCYMCQPCYLALYVLMEQNSERQYDNEITEICTSIRAMSRRFPFAFSLLHMTQIDLQQRGHELPSSVEKLFEEFEQLDTASWMEKGSHNSLYPSPQLGVGPYAGEDDSEATTLPTTMSEFLKAFDKLRIR